MRLAVATLIVVSQWQCDASSVIQSLANEITCSDQDASQARRRLTDSPQKGDANRGLNLSSLEKFGLASLVAVDWTAGFGGALALKSIANSNLHLLSNPLFGLVLFLGFVVIFTSSVLCHFARRISRTGQC